MFVCAAIIVLYFWSFFALTETTPAGLMISSNAVIASTIAFMLSFISHLWSPSKFVFQTSLAVYAMLAIVAGILIADSSGLSSPFIALWIVLAAFSAVFGLYGLVPMFLAGSSYLILAIAGGDVSQTKIAITVIAGYLPLIASFIIWSKQSEAKKTSGVSYGDLASELSQIAGKSEVVINAIADGVIAVDSQGVIQLINPAAQEIIGWGKQDAVKLSYKSVFKLLDKKNQELTTANDPVQLSLAGNKEVTSNDLTLITRTDKNLFISLIVSPVGKTGSGVILVFRDITKDKAEEREQAEFISTASHEMRTPVASIEGYLGLALNPATSQIDAKAREYINKAHDASRHLGRLFQDLLDVSKAEDGRLSNNPKVIDVISFTRDIVEGLRPQADAKNIRLLFKPGDQESPKLLEKVVNPVFFTFADNDHFREIIANLVENGIKYTLQGDVIVDVSGDNDRVVISIADSGIGIPAEDISHLFQKFYRVDNTDTREIGGTGLGLYLCRRLAEAIGGHINVESEYKKGSTFSLDLPRISHEEATKRIESETAEKNLPTDPVKQPEINQPNPASIELVSAAEPPVSTISTTESANVIAEQLRSLELTVSEITPPETPAIVAPRPIIENATLAEIEGNPTAYIRKRSVGITLPERKKDDDNRA